jgi:hypothetical protein
VSAVTVRYFTDPACPPDPSPLRLRWLYGDQLAWELRMIVLREQRGDGWPQAPGSDATIHACRAVVATGLRWPDRQERFLRRLSVLAASGAPLDDSDTLEIAAEQAGLPVAELAAYCAEPEVEAALRADMKAGRPCKTCEVVGDLATLDRREDPRSVAGVLAWAGMPLTTAEVAAVCGRPVTEGELAAMARLADGYWA